VLGYMRYTASPAMLAALDGPALDPRLLEAILLIFAQLSIVTAIALFFSTFSSPMLSASFTLGLYVAGQFSADLRNFDQIIDAPAAVAVARGLYWILPNMAAFDIKSQIVHAQPVAFGYVAATLAYGAAYVGMLLTLAVMVFARRDFK
jgi:hypothetical protein